MTIRKRTYPETSYSAVGNFNLTARKISSDELKKYQVFISHSNADGKDMLDKTVGALTEAGVNVAYDRAFLSGGDNFRKLITDNIRCYAGVVLITPAMLRSGWCSFEIGYFAGRELNVFLFDPDGLLEKETGNQYLNYHLHNYLPAFKTLDALVKAVSEASVYSDMFRNETESFTKRDFAKALAESVGTSVVTVSSPCFGKDVGAFSGCRFGTLVIHFGTFKTTVERGAPCYAAKGKTACIAGNDFCAVTPIGSINDNNRECVLLNHVLDNGSVTYGANGEPTVVFHVPVHKKYGTQFKFIVEAPDNDKLYRLMNIFEAAGMNPSLSESCNGGRIYLALPERETQGIFNIRGEFNNNFICPKALAGGSNG